MNPLPDFTTYFRALWGYDPFPWQRRLARQLENGCWPEWLTLPTGTGKTAAIDIAIYDLARQAALPVADRRAPVRIVFAVNRRIVVDEAFERARSISTLLAIACAYVKNSDLTEVEQLSYERIAILRPIADALRQLSGLKNGPPLEVFPLRGGTFTDHSWARTPTQPLVLTTTLDQLGSRLLFRGYGVSPGARPIHAALLANDSLLILDEAHTARAFSQTLASISGFREMTVEPLQLPFAFVQLTATPSQDAAADRTFGLDENDRANGEIRKRLAASKPAELHATEGAKGTARHKKLADAMSAKAREFLDSGNRRVLVVVNRVATAEALKDQLEKTRKDHGAEVEILTGRIRPLDRNGLIDSLDQEFQLKQKDPATDVPKLVLIATQTIEVGADFDFDALITELAPLDNLRQRFGRLNRHGREIPAPAAIFAPEEVLAEGSVDPIYGKCLPTVWKWLHQNVTDGQVDFGIDAMSRILPAGEALDELLAPALEAPILLEPHLDLLCQTFPEPHVSPDPALYIHGPGRNFPEIYVVLRADLEGVSDPDAVLKTVPPLSSEAATVPLHHARNWLLKPSSAPDTGGDAPAEDAKSTGGYGQLDFPGAWRWRNGEAHTLSHTRDLLPGDFLVLSVPDDSKEFLKRLQGLFPASGNLDQFEAAHLLARDRLAIRFHSGVRDRLEASLDTEDRAAFRELTEKLFVRDEMDGRWRFQENEWKPVFPQIAAFLAAKLPSDHPALEVWTHAAFLKSGPPRPADDWKAVPYPEKTYEGALLLNRSRVGATAWLLDPADLGRQGSQAAKEISLADHVSAVEIRAATNAASLSASLAAAVRDAAAWHDLGKLDPRFQAMLRGSSLLTVETREPLAKSGPRTGAQHTFYRSKTELPRDFRHELLSALIVDASAAGKNHPERDLLLHLIASHHGRCRSMAPAIPDKDPEPFDVDVAGETLVFEGCDCPLAAMSDGVTRRFWDLNRRFGWWGLPYLESLLRLADQYASANPAEKS